MAPGEAGPALGLWEACWHYLVLGVVQGLTEFLPISSTAHLKVVPVVLGWGDPGVAVTAVIQLGSIVAVIAFFRRDLVEVFSGMAQAVRSGEWQTPPARLGVAVALGTLPIVVAGLAVKLFVPDFDNSPLRSLPSIGAVSIVMAILLGLAEQIGQIAQPLRVGVTGSTVSPPIFDTLAILGKPSTLRRIDRCLQDFATAKM